MGTLEDADVISLPDTSMAVPVPLCRTRERVMPESPKLHLGHHL